MRPGKRSAGHGVKGACTCDSKCKQAPTASNPAGGCPCRAAPFAFCTPECARCSRPGAKCCNNAKGAAAELSIELLPCETATPADVTFEGQLDAPLALPSQCILVTGDLETTGAAGVYLNDITQLCFRAQLLTGTTIIPIDGEITTYSATTQTIPGWCTELTGIKSASQTDSQLHGAPNFTNVFKLWVHFIQSLREKAGTPATCPIVLAGHNFVNFDLVALYCQCRRSNIDLYRSLHALGAVGLIDTLHVARAVTWPTAPVNPDNGQKSFKLGACYAALGHGILLNAHDAGADVGANQCVLTSELFLNHLRASPSMYSLAQCILRARTMRQRWANMPSVTRERQEQALIIERFAEAAPPAARITLAAGGTTDRAMRGAAHGEAKRWGITSLSEGNEAAGTRRVVLVQAPPGEPEEVQRAPREEDL